MSCPATQDIVSLRLAGWYMRCVVVDAFYLKDPKLCGVRSRVGREDDPRSFL
jgi:hypothetical protein